MPTKTPKTPKKPKKQSRKGVSKSAGRGAAGKPSANCVANGQKGVVDAKRLYGGFIRAGNKEGRDGFPLCSWPKKLAATPSAKAVLGASGPTQVEMIGLAAAEISRGAKGSAAVLELLVNMLLRRALPLSPDALAELLEGIVKGNAFRVSAPVVANFLERWCKTGEMNARLVTAIRAYRTSLSDEFDRKAKERLLSLLGTAKKPSAAGAKSAAPEPAPTLSPAALDRLTDELVKSLPRDAYMATHLRGAGKLDEVAAMPPADVAEVVGRLADRLVAAVRKVDRAISDGNVGQSTWSHDGGPAMSLALQRLLARTLPLRPDVIAALCRTAVRSDDAVEPVWMYGSIKQIVRTVETAAEHGRLVGEAALAAEELRGALARTPGGEASRLAERMKRATEAAGGAAPMGAGERKGRAPEQSMLERALLTRESLRADGEWLFDRLLGAKIMPAAEDERGAVAFSTDGMGADADILGAVNERLRSVASRYASDEEKLAGPLVTVLRGSPGRAAAIAAACGAAMSRAAIRYEYNSARSNRFHNGLNSLVQAAPRLMAAAAKQTTPPDAGDLAEACHALSVLREPEFIVCDWGGAAKAAAAAAGPILARGARPPERLLVALLRLRERVARSMYHRNAVREFDAALGIAPDFCTDLGERWSDRMYQDLRAMPAGRRADWGALLRHCSLASGGQPSAKWLKPAAELLERITPAAVEAALAEWFSLVGKPRPPWPNGKVEGRDSSVPSDRGADVLKGLAWCASALDSPGAAQALGDLAMACYKMVPGVGARCIKPGTAAVWALSQMTVPEALGQLSRVRQLVKFGTAKKVLDGALDKLAKRLNMTTDELHEIAVPDFGLERGGVMREEAGDFTLELAIDGSATDLRVLDEKGAARKSVPDAVKKEHKATLAALKQAGADIDKMLAAQKDRLERLYHDQRSWPAPVWRARYLDHPLVGALAGRLIWSFTRDGRTTEALPIGGGLVDCRGKAFEPRDSDSVTLWHPVSADPSQVQAWRSLLEERRIVQPFKQAHREIYLLTDAERRTRIYSNRFAAHIIKQGQLHALCQQRGWKHALYVMDSGEPPMLHLPKWNLYAHYMVDPIGDDTYGTAGASAYLQTDQVAFTRTPRGERLPLEEVPALVFSEAMRDVDLFVAVASVGNNPEWHDGGPEAQFRNYWWDYGFGDLAESGRSRREVLGRLLPRLGIGGVCELQERFLRVKGKLRTYRIHLGSGNILMEPNDEYLCIVPGARAEPAGERVFLPFEGDRTLAIILSKALMLVEDDKITDPTITRQIRRKK